MCRKARKYIMMMLALCMCFVITTGTAMAFTVNVEDIDSGHKFSTGDEIECGITEGVTVKYCDVDGNTVDSPAVGTVGPGGTIVVEHTPNDLAPGYRADVWVVFEASNETDGNNTIYNLKLKPVTIDYYMDYYDGSTWIASAEPMTVEGSYVFNSTVTKDGYTLKGWDTDPSGNTAVYAPGAEVTKDFLVSLGEYNNQENPEKLYAVWEAKAGGNPTDSDDVTEPEDATTSENPTVSKDSTTPDDNTNTDTSPKTGDSTNILLWIVIAAIASIAGMGTLISRRTS